MTSRLARYAAALAGFGWYLLLGGLPTLNPVNLNWVLGGDWRQHLLGWLFFRNEPWTFPLGTITSLPYPIGSSIGFTDSNPLVSILLKPFSPWLPAEFQFIGPWLALCFILQGYFGAMLASTVTTKPVQQWLGGCVFAVSPVLAARLGHDTLCAQWLLLGLLSVGLREYRDDADVRRGARLAIILATLAASIHPYLTAMSATLAYAGYLRLWRARLVTGLRAVSLVALTTACMLAVMYAIGYFAGADSGSVGFGHYSADLATFFDSMGYSRLMPNLNLQEGRWEGFGFLGIGGLMGAAIAIVMWIRTRPALRRGTGVVITVAVLMFCFALSVRVTFLDTHIARLHHVYDSLSFLTGPFRASGRFIWPLYYLVLLAGIWAVTRERTGGAQLSTGALARSGALAYLRTGVLLAIVLVQSADFRQVYPLLEDKHFREPPDLSLAKGHYRHMAVYPAQILGACGGLYEEDHVYRFMLAAYRLNVTYNSGIFARASLERVQRTCGDFYRAVDKGQLDPQTIYVPSSWTVPHLKELGAACGRFDGDWICVSKDSDEVFRTYVATGRIIERKSP